MLTLVLGAAGSGKSRFCMEEAAALARAGKASVLVVPEQVAYTFERELVTRLPGTLAGFCEVKSFKRLCRDVLSQCGGAARGRLDEAEKTVLVRRAVGRCGDGLQYYRRRRNDAAFYGMLVRLFDELRNACATPGQLRELAERCSTKLSKQKFLEVSLLLENYEALLAERFFDDAGELLFAASLCEQAELLRGKTVFVDGFAGFTAAEREFLAAAVGAVDRLVVTLGCTGDARDYDSALGMPARTRDRLSALCREKFGIQPQTVQLSQDHRHKTAGTRAAERYFRDGSVSEAGAEGAVWLSAEDLYDEVQQAADEILRLVREEGYRFGEISLCVRDTGRYRGALRRTMDRFGIPYLFDEGETLTASPVVVFLLCAFEMAGGVKTESLLRMLKTGLADMGEEEISLLENYAYVHSVEGQSWLSPFAENPDGFGQPDDAARERLEKTEAARARLAGWISPYLEKSGRLRGAALLREAWQLMERCGAVEGAVRQHAEGRRNAQLAFSLVGRLHNLLGEDVLSREELCDTLRLLAGCTKAAQIPPVMDAVLVGGADHTMPFNPRASFLLGLNDGVFPRENFEGLILTLEERDLLFENKLVLAGSFSECCDMEAWFLYAAAAAPSERVYLSCCSAGQDSGSLPCAELLGFARSYGLQPAPRRALEGVVNEQTAAVRFALALEREESDVAAALLQSSAGARCGRLQTALQQRPFRLEDRGLARRLLGSRMRLSASKIDVFESCRFRYFLRYMMRVNPLKRVEMTPAEAGSFVHEVMEKLMLQQNGDLTAILPQQLRALCFALAEQYMDSRLPKEKRTPRMQALADQLGEATLRLALRLRAEQQQSRFRAADCELSIGPNGEVPGPEFPLPDGSTVVVEGSIDRVDVYQKDGVSYVRVVDYKTGSKEFRLSDVWQGINIQMLLYLFSLQENAPQRYGGEMQPVGVLYLPSDPSPADSAEKAAKVFRMNGILLEDEEILAAMEEKGEGIYIPTSKSSRGWNTKNLASAEMFGALKRRIAELIVEIGTALQEGSIEAKPAQKDNEPDACRYCDYRAVCMRDRLTELREIRQLDVREMLQEMQRKAEEKTAAEDAADPAQNQQKGEKEHG